MQSGRPQRSKSLICDCAFRFGVLDSFLMSVFTQGICLAQLRSSAFSVHPAHHTKCTKTRRKHEKEKDERASMHIVPSPVPQHQMALTRKPSVCLAEVVRFQRPTRQRNSRKGGQGRKNGGFFCFQKRRAGISFLILGCGRATPARSPTRWKYLMFVFWRGDSLFVGVCADFLYGVSVDTREKQTANHKSEICSPLRVFDPRLNRIFLAPSCSAPEHYRSDYEMKHITSYL